MDTGATGTTRPVPPRQSRPRLTAASKGESCPSRMLRRSCGLARSHSGVGREGEARPGYHMEAYRLRNPGDEGDEDGEGGEVQAPCKRRRHWPPTAWVSLRTRIAHAQHA